MNDQQFAVLDQLTLSAEVWHGEGLLMHGEIEHMTDRNDQYCCFMNFLAPRFATQHWTKDIAFNAAACNDFTRQLQVVVRVTDKVTMRTLKIFEGSCSTEAGLLTTTYLGPDGEKDVSRGLTLEASDPSYRLLPGRVTIKPAFMHMGGSNKMLELHVYVCPPDETPREMEELELFWWLKTKLPW
tara:strand:- start:478 stop:1029 length:552 start_codon:yes stop_codon:yes gene_type:complete